MDGNLMIYVVGGLAFLALAGLGLAFTGGESDVAVKRARQIKEGKKGKGRGGPETDSNSQRRRQTQQMLKKLRQQDAARRKSLMPQDIKAKLTQAGLDVKTGNVLAILGRAGRDAGRP